MLVTSATLDAFVTRSDELGGPNTAACQEYWVGFTYEPTLQVDQSLDPFSDAYVAQQQDLYSELSGRGFNQEENERTLFDITGYVDAPNPYNHPDASDLALHIQRLSKAFHLSGVKRGGHLLDMGSGWGLSSELGAYLGLRVTAVDINPDFVNLVNARAARTGSKIIAIQGEFDDYRPSEPVDVILFYECLHHALRPWTLIDTLRRGLTPGGSVVLAGEPINALWWTHWGMRLDAMSVYCIRKFGWFESGWSLPFITQVLERCGLEVEVVMDSDPNVGYTTIGRRKAAKVLTAAEFIGGTATEGVVLDQDYGVTSGEGWFDLVFPDGAEKAELKFQNFRAKPIELTCTVGDETVFSASIPHGPASVTIDQSAPVVRLAWISDVWVPAEEAGNGDPRRLSLHLTGVSFY